MKKLKISSIAVLPLLALFLMTGCDTVQVYNDRPEPRGRVRYNAPRNETSGRDDLVNDMTDFVLGSNRSALEDMKRKAANGDPEAQKWLDENGATFEAGNGAAQRMHEQNNSRSHE